MQVLSERTFPYCCRAPLQLWVSLSSHAFPGATGNIFFCSTLWNGSLSTSSALPQGLGEWPDLHKQSECQRFS